MGRLSSFPGIGCIISKYAQGIIINIGVFNSPLSIFLSPSLVRDQEAHPNRAHLREHSAAVRGQGREADRDSMEHEQQEIRC